ncbi:hypothetical protein PVM11_02935 [Enterobacter roggenkampii]|jgi:hypothetical protein|uniref:hypothetical protein n=1 Tax=Enterobacter roggenkampii TaxID=1812935 RepID=UPI001E635F2F|nr:hypothetical protein [Enterobacter roggenkampii]MCE1988664.1 hypothetical protein [Enterobacter roggenkampii]MCK6707692.1 hypothetical protein [Enterobacter roggenkampii]MCK6911219.1 hypothetical protein [Enterobacter roggenkampii]MCK7201693.1 hypothetical protein [Enterobacter roggenkampii]MDD9237868.1 hypothetical protein [Enterobacter roggenkampii]
MLPTLSQVIEVVRQSSGHYHKHIDANTLIEADLDICGMDGEALIEDCEAAFGVTLVTEEDGYEKTFSLADNELLFSTEGIDYFGICRLIRRIRGIPEPVIRDLTVGELHAVLIKAVKEQIKHE